MKIFIKRYICILCALIITLGLCGCAGGDTQQTTDTETQSAPVSVFDPTTEFVYRPYLILAVDTTLQQLILRDMDSTRQMLYTYNLSTQFKDKYGEFISITGFKPGKVAEIERADQNGLLQAIRLSDQVWEYSGVTDYTINQDKGMMSLKGVNYRLRDDTWVFSGENQSVITDIGASDILRVTGKDKDVWSIVVTTGHGTLSLINTSTFDGSLICVGDNYFLLNGDTQMEIREGTYTVTVANRGYGGSADVNIARSETSTLDLETLKGEGPKFCELTFRMSVPDAVISLDGKTVAKDEVMSIAYGSHRVSVSAPGYDGWSKTLYVNSPSATIVLEMTDEDNAPAGSGGSGSGGNSVSGNNDDSQETTNSSDNSGGSDNNSSDSGSGNREEERKEAQLEYLTTIRDMVTNMFSGL